MKGLSEGRRVGACRLVPVDVACEHADPSRTSMPCGSMNVTVHDQGHAWCGGCGARKDVPEYSPPPPRPWPSKAEQGGLFDDPPDDGYTEARG